MERDGGGGVLTAELSPSVSLEAGQAPAFSGPVNDAVLPSGRPLKATCHMSLSGRGFSGEEVRLSPTCQHER